MTATEYAALGGVWAAIGGVVALVIVLDERRRNRPRGA
jgi:hypothetical protein